MRLIAFDLDGTLLDHDKTVPARSARVIEELRARGVRFAVITGRAQVPQDVLATVRPDATATNNGGEVWVGETLVARHALTPEQLLAVDAAAPRGATVVAFGPQDVYSRDGAQSAFDWLAERTPKPLSQALHDTVLKYNFRHPEAWRYVDDLRALGLTVTGGVAPYEHFVTVTPARANKGEALREIARALSVPLAHTVAFGDSDNDLAMFEVAGRAVQVGDAACLAGAAHARVSCAALGLPGWLEGLLQELARDLPSGVSS